LLVISIALVLAGLGSGWLVYGRRTRANAEAPDPLAVAAPRLFAFLGARMKFDELYAATVGRLHTGAAALASGLDGRLWDGGVRLVARTAEVAGTFDKGADERGLNAGFDGGAGTLRAFGLAYSRAQTGAAQTYLRALAIAFVVLALVLLLGGAS